MCVIYNKYLLKKQNNSVTDDHMQLGAEERGGDMWWNQIISFICFATCERENIKE